MTNRYAFAAAGIVVATLGGIYAYTELALRSLHTAYGLDAV